MVGTRRARDRAAATSYPGGVPFETAVEQWQAGQRRLEEAPPDQRATLERVTRRVVDELRRRLGSTFTTEELAALYDDGTSWVSGVAIATAPDEPYAWDVRVVGDAAFHRYLREAADYAGGRRLT